MSLCIDFVNVKIVWNDFNVLKVAYYPTEDGMSSYVQF